MRLIDTHTHLYLPEFDNDRAEVMTRAFGNGVEKMIFPNVDLSTIAPMKELASAYPEKCFMAMGLHPTEVDAEWRSKLDVVLREFSGNQVNYVAVGEIGIDLYWDKTYRNEQKKVLAAQLSMANEMSLPAIIHSREGLEDVIDVFGLLPYIPRCVFHSFGGNVDDVRRLREKGDFFFGINGIVTFKNSQLRDVLPEIGLNRILLETDSPYLSPVPFRGKRNESAYIVKVAEHIAGALGMEPEDVAERTSRNAEEFFGI